MQDTVPTPPTLYDADFYAWTQAQAALLRAGRFSEADIANIVEEIETLGRSEKRELVSRLTVLLMHLLKWRYRPERQSKSWRLTIRNQRIDVRRHLRDNPSLKSLMPTAMSDAFESAVIDAALETELEENIFPKVCPWTYGEIINDEFWPEA